MLTAVSGRLIEAFVKQSVFYGLHGNKELELKWDAIDFEQAPSSFSIR